MPELMEITLNQTFFGQKTVNRWNYVANGTPGGVTLSFALASIMGFLPVTTTLTEGTVGGELQQLQTGDVVFNSILARAVYQDDDFYDSPFLAGTNGLGFDPGQSLSPINAFGFRSNRVKQSIGRGYKRFVGVGEGQVGAGGVVVAPATTQMESLKDAMNATLTFDDEGTTITFIPCIVQKHEPTGLPGEKGYFYYPLQSEQLLHTAQGITWEAYPQVRSQVSRQYGRGI